MNGVTLHLDELAAQDLADTLAARRQHLDTGTPIPEGSTASYGGLSAVSWEIRHQLGLPQLYEMGPPNPYKGASNLPATITLQLDPTTARDVDGALYDVGEHIAAGAPVGSGGEDSEGRLVAVVEAIRHRR